MSCPLYLIGAGVFVLKIPERWFPGMFDYAVSLGIRVSGQERAEIQGAGQCWLTITLPSRFLPPSSSTATSCGTYLS